MACRALRHSRADSLATGEREMAVRTGHLFAGAGGGLYADLILGHTPVFAVEWDDYAAGVLQRRADDGWFPGLHVHHGDVRLFDTSNWKGRVDSLHAGFPCQDISTAGTGAGITGERSGLWSEVKRAAGELGVGELFLENSPAITSRGLGVVLGDLAELGLDARWCVLPASGVGAPHLRARWWCLARRADCNSVRQLQPQGSISHQRGRTGDMGEISDAVCNRQQGSWESTESISEKTAGDWEADHAINERIGGFWELEPNVGRVVNGLANRSNRIKCLGNGQVPLQAAAAYRLLDAMF